jgi:hypothetical protein
MSFDRRIPNMENAVSDGESSSDNPASVNRERLSTDGGRRDPPQQNDRQHQGQRPREQQQPRGQQPQGRQPSRGQGPTGGRPPSQGNGGGGFSRRGLVLGGGGVAVAGWFFFLRSDSDDGSTGDSGPDPTRSETSVVEAYYGHVQNRNFDGAKSLIHPETSTPSDQQLEQLADTLEGVTAIEAAVANGPTPDADRSRYDTVQAFEAVTVTIEQEDGGTNYVSGTVAHHTDGRWLVWF